MSGSARNIVMLGDPMQLPMPTQGSHPGHSGKSCLEYMLAGERTIDPEMGVFLPTSFRMHPDICAVISDLVYEGKLGWDSRCEHHVLSPALGSAVPATSGIVWHPVERTGNAQSSREEADAVAALVDDLLGRRFHAERNTPLTLGDILIVTPCNAQVQQLTRRLPDGARVGTVDLFQGQEAPVVIISMASSSADIAPRGMDFLFDTNRLNVAVSRAQALTIIVGSEELARSTPGTVAQMRQANMVCRLREGTQV